MDNFDACLTSTANHVRRAPAARECDHEIGLALVNHALVTERAGGPTVLVPVSLKRRMLATRRVSFFNLKAEDCRWPLWKTDTPISDKQFCGRPALIGRPYCTHCEGLAVVPRRTESFEKKHGFFKFTKRGRR